MRSKLFTKILQRLTKRNIILFLCILEMFLIISIVISLNNKNVQMFTVDVGKIDNDILAFMLEDENGMYKESNETKFPKPAYYRFNANKSSCMNSKGKIIDNGLTYDVNKAEVNVLVRQAAYCYLYFDKVEYLQDYLIKHNDEFGMWQSGLEDDGYRFVGSGNAQASTSPKNFICFGTSDKGACTGSPNNYMYRIIGVFPDASGTQYVKLIKYASLTSAMAWNGNYSNDIAWEASDLHKNLNGSTFLTNTTYVPNATWSNKIANWRWSAVNTKTYTDSGLDFYDSVSPSNIYLHEMNRSNKTSTIGSWTTPTAKIGLIYASDYTLSLGQTAKNVTTGTYANRTTLKTGWMHIANNAYGFTSGNYQYEWTTSRYGFDDINGRYYAWYVSAAGNVSRMSLDYTNAVRPVFYLTEFNEYSIGTGTISDPIIIDGGSGPNVNASINDNVITATINKGDYELDSYCINESESENGCEWIPITTSTITKLVSKIATYYIHVTDKYGYISHSEGVKYTGPKFAKELITKGVMWQSGEMLDGYRFAGTSVNNYVCFGTDIKSTCTSNPNTYMYRIVGVFEDDANVQHVKLIKYSSLPSSMAWNSSATDVAWKDSSLFANLNGSGYLNNTTYVPNDTWKNKISEWKWTSINTLTPSGGPDYYNTLTPLQIYLHELNRPGKSTSVGEWTYPVAKIGLMYASDFPFSLGDQARKMSSGTQKNSNKLKNAWILLSKNANQSGVANEWTMSKYGPTGSWYIHSGNYVNWQSITTLGAVRPVFYLNSEVGLLGGTGTITDPYLLR